MGKVAKYQPTLEDEAQAAVTEAAAQAIGDWLMTRKIDRPIYTLTKEELTHMAAACITGYIDKRIELAAAMNWQSEDAKALLAG